MRWPLKNQIFVRLLFLLAVTIAAITYANIRSTFQESRERETRRISQVASMLRTTRFPLTPNVLQSMTALSGAEFQVTDSEGKLQSQTDQAPDQVPELTPSSGSENVSPPVPRSVELSGQNYLYTHIKSLGVPGSRTPGDSQVHIFVPQKRDREVWWQASRSPLLIAAIVLPAALLISLALAAQVTRPLANLEQQVREIATGNIRELEPSARNDEVRDLNLTINEMAILLRDRDHQVRQNERLRTLIQVNSGMAHHLRNSATGCKMALELLVSEHPDVAQSDTIDVARRQLDLMENYIRKFMSMAETDSGPQTVETTEVDLKEVLQKVSFLLSPSASHLNVQLKVQSKGDDARWMMQQDDAEQLMINLIKNAIEAASQQAVAKDPSDARVDVILDATDSNRVTFTVTDNGRGPDAEIADQLFQPFVSGKPEGTGLGLSLVREIANRVNGQIRWSRSDDLTKFEFEFPNPSMHQSHE